jgi:hypothetical protein
MEASPALSHLAANSADVLTFGQFLPDSLPFFPAIFGINIEIAS